MSTVKSLIKWLQTNYKPDDIICYDLWCIDDVESQANNMKEKLTMDEMKEVLNLMDRCKDATLGISWESVRCAIDEVVSDRNEL